MVTPVSAIVLPVSSAKDREARQVGGLALFGGHAERGVALEMFDRSKTLSGGEFDVPVGDVGPF